MFYTPCLSSFKKCYTSLFYSIFQVQCLHKYMTPFLFIPFSFFIIIHFMKYVSSIHIFSIGGSQTLPIKSEQWNGGEYGSVQAKCTNIAGKTLYEKIVALLIVIINSYSLILVPMAPNNLALRVWGGIGR